MYGIEKSYINACIRAMISAWRALQETPARNALSIVPYGKRDTLRLDAIPEIQIREKINDFDPNAILITEEEELDAEAQMRWPTDANPIRQPLILFSDPTDRSSQLKKFITAISKGNDRKKVGDFIRSRKVDAVAAWEKEFGAPADITGATTSITAIRKGELVFSVVLSYIVNKIYVACPWGVFQCQLPPFDQQMKVYNVDLEYIIKNGKSLKFPLASDTCKKYDDYKRYVTFLGKTGYDENFNECMVFVDKTRDYLHHKYPGGPARILYLSELQKGHGPVGFIVANGEKIGEWIHWLAFVKFAAKDPNSGSFRVFETWTDRPYFKYGMLMSTTPSYSIFRGEAKKLFLDISRLRYFDRPSKFRSMIVITPADNEYIPHNILGQKYREITSAF